MHACGNSEARFTELALQSMRSLQRIILIYHKAQPGCGFLGLWELGFLGDNKTCCCNFDLLRRVCLLQLLVRMRLGWCILDV